MDVSLRRRRYVCSVLQCDLVSEGLTRLEGIGQNAVLVEHKVPASKAYQGEQSAMFEGVVLRTHPASFYGAS